jgi:dsDNA-specific endonuclease/ATPase MutS2
MTAEARIAVNAGVVAAARAHAELTGAYDGLRAALADLRRSQHIECHTAAAEIARDAKSAVAALTRRAQEANPEFAARQARTKAKEARILAAAEAATARRATRRRP